MQTRPTFVSQSDTMRAFYFLFLVLLLPLANPALAAQPQLLLDVARFRNIDMSVKGNVVELYATVPGQWLTYMRRAPKMYQAAAILTLEIVGSNGQAAYQENITLKPPVLSDTTAAIKNPLSFQKRLMLPDGTYSIRGLVRDQYRNSQQALVEMPLVLASTEAKPTLSDVVLLAKPAAKGAEASNFSRGGFSLTRAPGGLYTRGADKVWLYTELYNATPEQEVQLRYRLRQVGAKTDALVQPSTTRGLAGRPTPITGELDLSKLPPGDYTLTVEVRTTKQLLVAQTATVHRITKDYTPAGAGAPAR
ncbi:hypothetical protein [Hymenobacter sp.]|uniref:hypothetical protein n=1 Tax=Hymenobacter sp. TaxID=1898978 RepID=UPI002ED96659